VHAGFLTLVDISSLNLYIYAHFKDIIVLDQICLNVVPTSFLKYIFHEKLRRPSTLYFKI